MKLKIAIAEDNHFLAKAVIEKLSFFDDFVFKFKAANGAEMVRKLEANHNIDVILMDIQMPNMDGYAATKMLRDRGFEDLVICGLSANAMKSDFNKVETTRVSSRSR